MLKISDIRRNIVNILIFITIYSSVLNQIVSERITCKSRPTNKIFKANFNQ